MLVFIGGELHGETRSISRYMLRYTYSEHVPNGQLYTQTYRRETLFKDVEDIDEVDVMVYDGFTYISRAMAQIKYMQIIKDRLRGE